MDKAGLPQANKQVGRQGQVGGLLEKTACEGEERRRAAAEALEMGRRQVQGDGSFSIRNVTCKKNKNNKNKRNVTCARAAGGTARQDTGQPGTGTLASVGGQDGGARWWGGTGRSLRGIFQQSISWLGEGLTPPHPHICPQTNEIPGLLPGRGRTSRETVNLS